MVRSLSASQETTLLANGNYGYDFGYTPKRNGASRQIDLLRRQADELELPPLYVLYNGADFAIARESWRCEVIPFAPASMGAAILPAEIASWLLNLGDVSQEA